MILAGVDPARILANRHEEGTDMNLPRFGSMLLIAATSLLATGCTYTCHNYQPRTSDSAVEGWRSTASAEPERQPMFRKDEK